MQTTRCKGKRKEYERKWSSVKKKKKGWKTKLVDNDSKMETRETLKRNKIFSQRKGKSWGNPLSGRRKHYSVNKTNFASFRKKGGCRRLEDKEKAIKLTPGGEQKNTKREKIHLRKKKEGNLDRRRRKTGKRKDSSRSGGNLLTWRGMTIHRNMGT